MRDRIFVSTKQMVWLSKQINILNFVVAEGHPLTNDTIKHFAFNIYNSGEEKCRKKMKREREYTKRKNSAKLAIKK